MKITIPKRKQENRPSASKGGTNEIYREVI